MNNKENIIKQIKAAVNRTAPDATLILYGSYARNDYTENSDLDLLVILEKEKITRKDEKRVKCPLYEIEFEMGTIISPMVFSKKDWETKHRKTPFYENVRREGEVL